MRVDIVQAVVAPVAVGRRGGAEAEARREERHLGACAGECGRQLVVVLRRERRGICQADSHATVGFAACRF
jgi:hypothetical protein